MLKMWSLLLLALTIKKSKESVKLTEEQWEAINSAVEDYCLRLCADGEKDYLAVMQDAQKALLEELGQCE